MRRRKWLESRWHGWLSCDVAHHFVSNSKGICVCDAANGWTDDGADGCMCNAEKGWTSDGADGCMCNAAKGWTSDGAGGCMCEAENSWSMDGTCVLCDDDPLSDQCVQPKDIVTFGQYPQSTETPEPIEWIVLEITPKTDSADGRILLLSKYVLDAKQFHTSNTCLSWGESDIRAWLNDTSDSGFLSSAHFTSQNMSRIVEVTKTTYEPGDLEIETNDRVFILDYDEAETYLSKKAARVSMATTHAMNNGVMTYIKNSNGRYVQNPSGAAVCANAQCPASWWIREIYSENTSQAFGVDKVGDYYEYYITNTEVGIRPALWVRF